MVNPVEAAAIALPVRAGAYHPFYVYDHTLCVLCGKYTPEDAVCGETLTQLFVSFFDSMSFPHLHKPGDDTNLFDLVNHKTAQRCFSENTQYLQFIFQFGMKGQGLFKHGLFS